MCVKNSYKDDKMLNERQSWWLGILLAIWHYYVKKTSSPIAGQARLRLRLVIVAGEYQRPHPPTHRPSFYTGPLQSSTNCVN